MPACPKLSWPPPRTASHTALTHAHAHNRRLLQLPGPGLNELGRAVWPVSSSEVSKAYRKLSLLVHPDKAPGPEARKAFEQLKQAYNELKDADKLVSASPSSAAAGATADRCADASSPPRLPARCQLSEAASERRREQPCTQAADTCSAQLYGNACACCAGAGRMQAARLREAEPALQKAAERAAAAASVTDKVGLNAAAEERKAKLRQQEVRTQRQRQRQPSQKPCCTPVGL
jgi:DnaJ family protein C protein 8